MRRMGELLKEQPKAKGTRGQGRPTIGGSHKEPPNDEPTLADLGITKKQSHVAQLAASVPEKTVERFIAENFRRPAS